MSSTVPTTQDRGTGRPGLDRGWGRDVSLPQTKGYSGGQQAQMGSCSVPGPRPRSRPASRTVHQAVLGKPPHTPHTFFWTSGSSLHRSVALVPCPAHGTHSPKLRPAGQPPGQGPSLSDDKQRLGPQSCLQANSCRAAPTRKCLFLAGCPPPREVLPAEAGA